MGDVDSENDDPFDNTSMAGRTMVCSRCLYLFIYLFIYSYIYLFLRVVKYTRRQIPVHEPEIQCDLNFVLF